MFLHLTNSNGEILHSNVPDECMGCPGMMQSEIGRTVCPGTGQLRRRAYRESAHGSVYFCGDEAALLKSRRIVRERLRVYSEMLQELEALRRAVAHNVSKHLRRLMHNLTSQNAHSIQEVYNVIPQELLSGSMSQQVENVEAALRNDPAKASKAFLRVNKHNAAMKCEFGAFKFLYESTAPTLKKRNHPLRKVVLNALHLFYQDFKEKHVKVDVVACDASVRVDYECLQVALYHVIDNAAKYVFNGSNLLVTFPVIDGHQVVRLDMMSLEITDSDAARLYDDGFSGKHPKRLGLAGAGLGLGIVRDLLKLNDARLEIHRNAVPARRQDVMMGVYENNVFDILLGPPM